MKKFNYKKYMTLEILVNSMFMLLMICVFIWFVQIRLDNPDSTSMRLLIDYWPAYLLGSITCIVCYIGIKTISETPK